MKLFELFDTNVELKITRKDNRWIASKDIGDRKIIFSAELVNSPDRHQTDLWSIDFFEVKDGDNSQDATGSGNELEVGAMVTKAMTQFLSDKHPESFRFTGATETRIKIYKRVCDRLVGDSYTVEKLKLHAGYRLTYTKA